MRIDIDQGTVENGQIRLSPSVRLPEKATVYVVFPGLVQAQANYMSSPRLAHPGQAVNFKKEVVELTQP